VAVHEAGHALVAALSPHADPVSRVTVLGAGQHGFSTRSGNDGKQPVLIGQ
jgi:ATP-dependent Zn protease